MLFLFFYNYVFILFEIEIELIPLPDSSATERSSRHKQLTFFTSMVLWIIVLSQWILAEIFPFSWKPFCKRNIKYIREFLC